jgi:hypothetical protein
MDNSYDIKEILIVTRHGGYVIGRLNVEERGGAGCSEEFELSL